MKKVILIVSIVLNVMLIVTIVAGIRYYRRTAFQMVSDFTMSEVRLQELYLKELDSAESNRIETVKNMMRRNIKNGKNAADTWASAAKW